VQNVEHVLDGYIISDRPMTEEEWIKARANRRHTKIGAGQVITVTDRPV
jgi:hypothetical protein